MNYLVAVDRFYLDFPGGAYKIAWEIAVRMKNEGHRVAILCIGDGLKPPCENYSGVRIVRYVPKRSLNLLRKVENHLESAAEAAKKYLGEVSWNVIHAHTPLPGLGALRVFGNNVRKVYTIHSPLIMEQEINWLSQGIPGRLKLWFAAKTLKKLEMQVYQSFDVLQSLSHFTRTEVDKLYGVGNKIRVIPFWATYNIKSDCKKAEARKKLGWLTDGKLLFSLRRMTARMGLEDAISAAGRLVGKYNFLLVLAGDGPLRKKLEQQAIALGLRDRIIFPGRLSDEQVSLAYHAADLFVLPTRQLECFGIIILEAYSFGCPVLAADTGAISELVKPVSEELLYPAGNVNALTQKISDFLESKLNVPASDLLKNYITENYAENVIYPKWRQMLLCS